MTSPTVGALAGAVAAMVDEYDVGDLLAELLQGCVTTYPATAAAVLVRDERTRLELLASSSQRSEDLELIQVQHESGPCVDAIAAGELVVVSGRSALEGTWSGGVGTAIVEAGFGAVHAFPMRWLGEAIGGLNLFLEDEVEPDAAMRATGQAFADVATLALAQSFRLGRASVAERVQEALVARTVVEQAKGVLAYDDGLDLEAAHEALHDEARRSGRSTTEVARSVVDEAQRPR